MTTLAPTTDTTATVGDALAMVHEGWMKQVSTVLAPALSEASDFWSRWAGARFLADQFGRRFRLECALLDALGPLLLGEAARTVAVARTGLERKAEELMMAGRRRGTGAVMARAARQFIDQLALWFVEVELATCHIEAAELSAPARGLLTSLQLTDALSSGRAGAVPEASTAMR
jgi:hypothetical protein